MLSEGGELVSLCVCVSVCMCVSVLQYVYDSMKPGALRTQEEVC